MSKPTYAIWSISKNKDNITSTDYIIKDLCINELEEYATKFIGQMLGKDWKKKYTSEFNQTENRITILLRQLKVWKYKVIFEEITENNYTKYIKDLKWYKENY